MSVVALVGTTGGPGVTTLACMLGALWPRERSVVVAECDPSGGDVAARFGLATDTGMSSLVVTRRSGPSAAEGPDLSRHVQMLPGGLAVLVGPVGGDAGTAVDRELASFGLTSMSTDVVADCGRLDVHATGQRRVVRDADRVVLLVRSEAAAIAHGRWTAERVAGHRGGELAGIGVVVTGRAAFRAPEVAEALGVELLGALPRDRAAAAMLAGQPGSRRALVRTPLVVAGRKLVDQLVPAPLVEERRDAS